MTPITHILFPYDFTPSGEQAAPFVTALASRVHAAVTLYSVMPPAFDAAPMDLGERVGDDPAAWKRQLQTRLDGALAGALCGVQVNRVADYGDPALRIVRFAEENGVDVIMMPTHGRGLFRQMLLGSVTSKVLHDARMPVWTAAHADTQAASPAPKTILCAVDGGLHTTVLLRWAEAFSRKCGAALRLLHVVGPVTDINWLESERQRQEQFRQYELRRVGTICRDAGVEAPLEAVIGEVAPAVAEVARRDGADLIVIGRGAIAEPFGRLRTQVMGIVQRSPCPVLSV